MPGHKIFEGNPHFLTTTVVDWIDLFTRKEYCLEIIDSLQYCQEAKGLIIHGYVIMPSHLHMILSTKDDKNLSDVLRDFKQFTSRKIIKLIQEIPESRRDWLLERFSKAAKKNPKIRHYQLWQAGNHPKVIQSIPFMLQKLEYIHQNPVKAMIVTEPTHYVFSSAAAYSGQDSLLEIDLVN